MIQIRPYITEKTVDLARQNAYTLVVSSDLSKPAIVSLVKKLFKVSPQSVKTLCQKTVVSKNRRGITRSQRGFKKVIVCLKKGESIPGYKSFTEGKEKNQENVKNEPKVKK